MAEEAPAVQNWKLLCIAGALAAVVVLAYNFHVGQIRSSYEGRKVILARFNQDLNPGDMITENSIEWVPVDTRVADGLGKVVDKENLKDAIGREHISRGVKKGAWFLWSFVTGDDRTSPSENIKPGTKAFSVEVDPAGVPGDLLRVGNYVDVLGMISTGGDAKYMAIIERVKVLAVGGKGVKDDSGGRGDEGQRSYRSLTIEVAPDVALQLSNVLTHVIGGVKVMLRNPLDRQCSPGLAEGQVNPALAKLAAANKEVNAPAEQPAKVR